MIVEKKFIRQLVTGMKILEFLSKQDSSTLNEIASKTKIPRTSVFRLLSTLESLEYVDRVCDQGLDRWCLGLKLLTLSNLKLSTLNLIKEARGVMEELAEETGLSVQLCVFYKNKVMYIDHVKRPQLLTLYAEVGTQLPINVCAPGMVLAASLEKNKLNRLLREETFLKNTPKTSTEPNEIRKILKKVARQGFAIDDQQTAIGIRCIAAPILDYRNCVIAAINITGSSLTISDEQIPTLVGQVKSAAENASKKMGYTCSRIS